MSGRRKTSLAYFEQIVVSIFDLEFRVYNQYRDPEIVGNVRVYLEYLLDHRSSLLLVGEAPGYKGCRLSGIPFTSGNIVNTSLHPFFRECRTRLVLKQVMSEATAKIFWEFLGKDKPLPILAL